MASVIENPAKKAPGAPPARRPGKRHSKTRRGESTQPRSVTQTDPTKAQRVRWDRLSYWAVGWLALVHAGALLAPWTFTWTALIATLVLHWITGGLGICLGYHRFLTHSGFKTTRPMRYLFGFLGTMAGEGSPLDWVADHRKHHKLSDQPGDPHSPHDGSWWSHILWLAYHSHEGDRNAYHQRWVPDLANDPGMRVLDKMFLPLHVLSGLAFAGVGYLIGGGAMAASLVVWCVFVRLVFVLHSTWMVNSASHMWGYRNYQTTDDSRNNWFVALVSYGEGWHNNHHAYPRMAKHGHRWWEIDITYATIRLLKAVGLVWDVVDYRTVAEKRQRGG
jgi:fatty-acid desaturase